MGTGEVSRRLPAVGSIPPARLRVLVLGALALMTIQFLVVGSIQAWHDSPTVDEAIDLSSGVTNLARRDLRLNPEHGILPRLAGAAPSLLAGPEIPGGAAYRSGDWFDHAEDFLVANREAGKLQRVAFFGRLVPLAAGLAGGFLIFRLGARFGGSMGGVLAAGLWLTTPVVVGLSHFLMIDVPFAVATLGVVLASVRLIEAPSSGRAAVLGVVLSAALLTRHSALVLLVTAPVAVLWLLRSRGREAARFVGVAVLVAWAGVWVGTRLVDPTPVGGPPRDRFDAMIATAADDSLAARTALAIPWPVEYRAGLAHLVLTSDERPAYLLGKAWDGGQWWYFPGTLLAKIPAPALATVLVGMVGLARLPQGDRRDVAVVLGVTGVASLVFLMVQPLNLGIRLAMPVVALLFVAAAAAVRVVKGWVGAAALVLLAVAQLGALWSSHPHSLAWTPWPFTPAYRWVSDSNVDFAQDLDRLEHELAGRTVYVDLLRPRGVELPEAAVPIPEDPSLIRGWVAVSATQLTARSRAELSWLRAYCPVDDVGGSILIYRFDAPPDPTPGPTMPAAPCGPGKRFSSR
jgi:hypothetical protein